MKQIVLLFIASYQNIISPLFHQLLGQRSFCRYETTCSTYAKEAILQHGTIKGGFLALKRLLSCQPFINSYATN